MRGLLADRFLRRFAGDLKYWREQPDSTGEGQNSEAGVDAALGPEVVRSDSHASEEDCEEAVTASAVADANNASNKADPNRWYRAEPTTKRDG